MIETLWHMNRQRDQRKIMKTDPKIHGNSVYDKGASGITGAKIDFFSKMVAIWQKIKIDLYLNLDTRIHSK